MSTSARTRLFRHDFKKITSDPPQGINAAPIENNIMVWQAVIFGPDDTPWEGGTFSCVARRATIRARHFAGAARARVDAAPTPRTPPAHTTPQARARV